MFFILWFNDVWCKFKVVELRVFKFLIKLKVYDDFCSISIKGSK